MDPQVLERIMAQIGGLKQPGQAERQMLGAAQSNAAPQGPSPDAVQAALNQLRQPGPEQAGALPTGTHADTMAQMRPPNPAMPGQASQLGDPRKRF